MKKTLTIAALVILLASCSSPSSILPKSEFRVIDTLSTIKNGYNTVLGYNVIIRLEQDSSFHFGGIDISGKLRFVKITKLDLNKFK